jgi:hypothetical protein
MTRKCEHSPSTFMMIDIRYQTSCLRLSQGLIGREWWRQTNLTGRNTTLLWMSVKRMTGYSA